MSVVATLAVAGQGGEESILPEGEVSEVLTAAVAEVAGEEAESSVATASPSIDWMTGLVNLQGLAPISALATPARHGVKARSMKRSQNDDVNGGLRQGVRPMRVPAMWPIQTRR